MYFGAKSHYEKSPHSHSYNHRFDFDILLCKRNLKIKNLAPGPGKKSSRHTICKTFRSWSAKALRTLTTGRQARFAGF